MKVLIGQPFQENGIDQLRILLEKNNINLVLFPEGYLVNEIVFEKARKLAVQFEIAIATSFNDPLDRKSRAVIIDKNGEVYLKRKKTPIDEQLLNPSQVVTSIGKIGFLLCREIYLDYSVLKGVDLIVNPIGVGMYNEEQFDEWIDRVRTISQDLQVLVIGASHADGFYKENNVSIPIGYCFCRGKEVFISKADIQPRIIDLDTMKMTIV